jgi:hypothetical protein
MNYIQLVSPRPSSVIQSLLFYNAPNSEPWGKWLAIRWKILLSLLLGSLDLRLDFTDPSDPIFTGTTGISISCWSTINNTSPLTVYHLSLFHPIPQHPVLLASVYPNRPRRPPHPRDWTDRGRLSTTSWKIVQSILGNSFVFLSLL